MSEPQSDLQKFKELYRSLGIELKVNKGKDIDYILLGDSLERGENTGGFEGYNGFYSKIVFDKDGKFIKQGFWE